MAKKKRRKRGSKLKRQYKSAAVRGKYGPSRKPAPVTVKKADGSETVVNQWSFTKENTRYQSSELLEAKAQKSGFESYAAYLQSKGWKQKRREALERDGWRCVGCECKIRLQVHHRCYPKRLGEEKLHHLETLCGACHDKQHGRGVRSDEARLARRDAGKEAAEAEVR